VIRNTLNSALLACLLLSSGMASCRNGGNLKVAAILRSDCCACDAANTYEVFVPKRLKSDQTFPLLVILDPHGSGQSALSHFRLAAEQYPAVLVASNLVKNNLAGYDEVIQELIDDVRTKYPIGKVVFISGFSGGARMAIGYAMNHPVNGLLLSGALAGPDELRKVGCLVYSISGTDDFNFMETAQYLFQEASIPENLKIELIRSSHSWPESLTIADAFGFIHLACPAAEALAESRISLKEFDKQQFDKFDTLLQRNDLIKAKQLTRNMSGTIPFNSDRSFTAADETVKLTADYAVQMKNLLANLQMETNVRAVYLKAFDTNDATWWKNELEKVDHQIQISTDPFTQDAYRRIEGFWGIACYSLCNKVAGNGDFRSLQHYVSIYRVLEPQNPDMLRFSKLLVQ